MSYNTMLPLEIIDNVLSFADFLELYRYREICRTWQRLAEQHIYEKARVTNLILQTEVAHYCEQELAMVAHSFDPVHRVIEFRPRDATLPIAKDATLPPSNFRTLPPNIFRRLVKLFFEPWKHVPMPAGLPEKYQKLVPSYGQYNPALEQRYMLPESSSTHSAEYETHLIAKRGVIMSFSYVHRADVRQQRRELERQTTAGAINDNNELLPITQRGYPASVTATPWLPRACGIQVNWLKASIPWLVSGFHPYVAVPHIYPERYSHLQTTLADKYRIFRYYIYSEPVTKYILDDEQHQNNRLNNSDRLPKDLVNYLRMYTDEDDPSIESQLSLLERTLEYENIDSRSLWKYRYVRYGIFTNFAPGYSRDIIIGQILAAEKRLQQEKERIIELYKSSKN
ncbi:hypothetical protein BDB00DRAFT_65497 [Zychaea mexicana]|uniref:uncharacterized protein n=1 Tax=Zychaea mexicana TaxID=64656 RepID=UPI0022FDE037|nr:uncharacterized protein BDB00DRAFT_65497 [Zychaea mexicana]KAI9488156.1 hypothetical protein BDB00DRAFT_65497 [Zychaea mexicana]